MKHIKTPIAVLLAVCLLLTGCNNGTENQSNSDNSSTQSTSETSSLKPEVSQPSFSDLTDPRNPEETNSPETLSEIKEIFKLLKNCKSICWGMFPFDLNKDIMDTDQKITVDYLFYNEKTYYKVVNGNIKTEAQFIEALDLVFTEKRKNEFLKKRERPFLFNNGYLYIGELGAGGSGYFNKLILNNIAYPNINTVLLNMTAFGEKEYFGIDENSVYDFSVKLVKTSSGLRIDECDIDDMIYIFNEVVYKDNVIVISQNNKLTEAEQKILKAMKDYADFYYGMQPGSGAALELITDKASTLTADGRKYLKCKGAPADTLTELNEKLDGLVTEKLKNEFVDLITKNGYTYQIKNGDIYITEEACAYGMGMGTDKLFLNSIDFSDEKTVLVNMTSFGDKNKWETENDIEENFTVKLVRTDNGFKIDECDLNAAAYLFHYNEIFYGDISVSL